MGFDLSFNPTVTWPVFWLLCAVAAAIGLALVYLRRRGWLLRLLSLLLVVGALANPLLSAEDRQPLSDIVAVVVDDSDSQSIGNRREQTATAIAEVEKRLAGLGNTEMRVGHTITGTTADSDGTRVFAALEKLVERIPTERYAGAIIISDGQIHDVPVKLSPTIGNGPIHGLLSGSKKETDRRVVIDQSPRFAITGQNQDIIFHIEDSPAGTGEVAVTLRMPNGEERQISLAPNTPNTISLDIAHAGQNLLQIEVAPRENEVTLTNNKALVQIKGIRDRLRVLLVSGEPHPGERTWRNILKADAAVDLVHFTILRPPEKQDGTLTKELSLIAFPTRELFLDKIKSFDLVIFDRYRMQSILPDNYLANVSNYVREGGAVLIASGPDLAAVDGLFSTPLADIMPASPTGEITEQAFRPKITKEGFRHPVSQGLKGSNSPTNEPTWGRWFRVIDANTNPDANALMEGPDQKPLLVLSHVGEGRVAQFMSDHGWLWARGYEGGGPQIELLRRLAHWLMREPDLEEEALLARQDGQNILIERRTLKDKADPVELKNPDGKVQKLELKETSPGLFATRIPMDDPGLYTVTDGTLTTLAVIGTTDVKETSDVKATPDKLKAVTQETRSGIYWIEDGLPRLTKAKPANLMAGSGWAAVKDNGQFRVTSIKEIPLFATLISLALLLLAVTAMWFREGR